MPFQCIKYVQICTCACMSRQRSPTTPKCCHCFRTPCPLQHRRPTSRAWLPLLIATVCTATLVHMPLHLSVPKRFGLHHHGKHVFHAQQAQQCQMQLKLGMTASYLPATCHSGALPLMLLDPLKPYHHMTWQCVVLLCCSQCLVHVWQIAWVLARCDK